MKGTKNYFRLTRHSFLSYRSALVNSVIKRGYYSKIFFAGCHIIISKVFRGSCIPFIYFWEGPIQCPPCEINKTEKPFSLQDDEKGDIKDNNFDSLFEIMTRVKMSFVITRT